MHACRAAVRGFQPRVMTANPHVSRPGDADASRCSCSARHVRLVSRRSFRQTGLMGSSLRVEAARLYELAVIMPTIAMRQVTGYVDVIQPLRSSRSST